MQKFYPYLITVSHMINDSCQSVLPALLPLFIFTYGLTLEQAGFLILANTALSSLLQPLLGYISDKIHQPRLIALGVLLSACSIGVMGIVTSYESLLICATSAGIGSSVFHPEGAKIMNRLGGGKKGKAMGTFAIGGSSGFAFGPLFAGAIAYTVGPHGLLAFTVVGIIVSVILCILMPRIEAHANTIEQAVITRNHTVPAVPLKNYWMYFGILFIIILSQSINFRVINAFIPVFWTRELGTSPEQGSFALTVFFSIGIFMTYIGGLLGDKYGPIKIIRLSLLLWLPSMFLLPQVPEFSATIMLPLGYLLLVIIGAAKALSYSPVIVLGQTYLAKSIGFAAGVTLGVSQTIGGIIAPVVGNIADTYSLPVAMMTLVPFLLIGLIASLFLKDPKKLGV
ncbi:MFS transporter [Veillonella denticariosi JCM 15641]|uniref:MFS transporter n=1 Tax=Veillonella denticariosi JCM 15641 TaxID=1298594 RepID=A0A2S7ZD90_9FIRM|nr:MFS transporter [Veillonella denticariosi]PQL21199.1 MFS transporter [Veillonella denticariosi JCM 15641]